MPLSQATFAAVVLEDTDGRWEIVRGKLREKPEMSYGHNRSARALARQLLIQLDPEEHDVLQNAGHLTLPDGDSYVPDVAVVPRRLSAAFFERPRSFEAYADALPFVVEVWSPSTGTYDVDRKIPGYRSRGDAEVWRIHPFEKDVRIWRREPNGDYEETTVRAGIIRLHALPDVTIELDPLFAT